MKSAELALTALLPAQPTVTHLEVDRYRGDLIDGKLLSPVRALSYPDDNSETYILLDGHHRAKAAHLQGLFTIAGSLFETDQEISDFAYTRKWRWDDPPYTKDKVRGMYRDGWRLRAEGAGSISIARLVLASI